MNRITKSLLLSCLIVLVGCQSGDLNTQTSFLTGWKTFDKGTTNFEAYAGAINPTPPGMVAVPGGSFTIGQADEFITAPHNSVRRTLTVSPFYMDKYEVTNLGWREYVEWMSFVFANHAPELVEATLPDTTVWRNELSYNEPYVTNYFRHPSYSFYPVVGVSWDQAMAYCQWRTDRVNERLLTAGNYIDQLPYDMINPNAYMTAEEIDEFLLNNPDHPEYANYEKVAVEVPASQLESNENAAPGEMVTMYRLPYEWIRDHFVFNTEKYLSSSYSPTHGKGARTDAYGNTRKVNLADGVMVVGYRLPTEAEWEYAALAPIATKDGIPAEGRIYPWSGYAVRDITKQGKGKMRANYVRTRGDMMGIAGAPNDGYVITAPVDAFAANDFGLYNMAGNVNEWVLDVYRETTYEDVTEYNPFRGNIYSTIKRDSLGKAMMTPTGCLALEYNAEGDKRDYKDGDIMSNLDTDYPLDTTGVTGENIQYDPTNVLAPRLSKNTRVYKGGSWNDRLYWLNPSTRRYMEQDQASSTIGFRCAMSVVGE